MKEFLSNFDLVVNLCCTEDDGDLPTYYVPSYPAVPPSNKDPETWNVIFDGLVWNVPIRDRKAPKKKDETIFQTSVGAIAMMMKRDAAKVYVHCRGGHGRSGLFVGCLLAVLRPELSIEDIFERLARYHSNRKSMSDRMRKLGCPQTRVQKEYVKVFRERTAEKLLEIASSSSACMQEPEMCGGK